MVVRAAVSADLPADLKRGLVCSPATEAGTTTGLQVTAALRVPFSV
jgi:hypothetical protein